eukprot:scaffold2878_cov73-Phaeocystis_antarctica.AAC.5
MMQLDSKNRAGIRHGFVWGRHQRPEAAGRSTISWPPLCAHTLLRCSDADKTPPDRWATEDMPSALTCRAAQPVEDVLSRP